MVRLGIHVGSAAVVHTLLNVPHIHKHALTVTSHTHTHTNSGLVVESICLISCMPQICNAVKKKLLVQTLNLCSVLCTYIVDAIEYRLCMCIMHLRKSVSDHIYMGSPYDLFIVRGRETQVFVVRHKNNWLDNSL